MAKFFNQYEVERMADWANSDPDLAPFGRIALQFVETINANSDGWSYWKAGIRASSKFLSILETLTDPRLTSTYSRDTKPTIADLRRSMAPMKSLITKHKFPSLPTV